MNRLEKFKEIRRYRRKIAASFFLSASLLLTGTFITDRSVNSLVRDVEGIEIISIINSGSYIELSFMNQKLYFNTTYLNRDYSRVRDGIANLLGIR